MARANQLTESSDGLKRRWWILAAMAMSVAMVFIDQTGISVALPAIQRELHLTSIELQWVVNSYLITFAVLVAFGGRLGDMLGHAKVFRIGIAIFILGSALCGLARGDSGLFACRVLQGAGSALMTPASSVIVTKAFREDERGKAMGLYSGASVVFVALGPLIAGALTEFSTWRMVFFVNVPIGIAVLYLTYRILPRDAVAHEERMDWVGLYLITFGLGSVVIGLMQSRASEWGPGILIALLSGGGLLLGAFVMRELKVRHPLIQLRLFSGRNFRTNCATLGIARFTLSGLAVLGSIWVQDVLGYSPVQAGLALLAFTLPLLFVSFVVGFIYDRRGPRGLIIGGMLCMAMGTLWLSISAHTLAFWPVAPGYILVGIGVGLVYSPANTDALYSAKASLRGQASGVIVTSRQVGATLGIAVMGTISAHVQGNSLARVLESDGITHGRVTELEPALGRIISEGADLSTTIGGSHMEVQALKEAITDGVSAACVGASAICALGCALAIFTLEGKSREQADS